MIIGRFAAMRKRRGFTTILTLLFSIGIPTSFFVWAIHKEECSYALIVALRANDTNKALIALREGADPNTRDNAQIEPPSVREILQQWLQSLQQRTHPAQPKNNPTALLMLFGARHDPYSNTNYSVEPIEQLPLLKALLERGAYVTAQDDTRRTPLMLATFLSSNASTRLLLQYGADVRVKDEEGNTALDYVRSGDDKERSDGSGEEIERMLRKAGAKSGSY